jgi:hypothetical protein
VHRRNAVLSCLVAVALVALGVAACGAEDRGASVAWGQAAETWLDNVQEAGREGVPNIEAFLAPGVVLDHRGSGGERAEGVAATLSLIRHLEHTQPGMRLVGPAYLSADGMVVTVAWQGPTPLIVHDAVLILSLSEDGLVRGESASSVVSGDALVDADRDWASLLSLAEAYAVGHSDGDVTTTVEEIPGHGGPAVFGVPRPGADEGFRRVVMLLLAGDGSGCPGHVAVSLSLGEDGSVVSRERFHRIDDGRRCLGGTKMSTGWWSTMDVPEPVRHDRTGTVRSDGAAVEVWNGTPALEALVAWAVERFPAAGLEVPRPKSVTFYPTADRCWGNLAVAGGEANAEILACFGEGLACPTYPCPPWSARAEHTMLHELAHTWMASHLDDETRETYEERVGLEWADDDDPWEGRAIERAAEVIAWGLQVAPEPPRDLALTEDELDEEFTFLTGMPPMSRRQR